ncbi:pyridoxal phosphate-dependent aminotransferase [Myxococcaceae bacterium GXIMD 01537]
MSLFSTRTAFARAWNPLAEALAEHRAHGRPLLDLTETNPTRVGLPTPSPALLALPGALAYAPEPLGLPSARAALASWLSARGPRVEPEHLVLSASTSEAYGWLFKLLCEPGDNVLVPAPSYPLFEYLTRLESVEARPYRLPLAHGFGLDVGEVEAARDARTRAVLVVNPGNPTGHFLHEGELEALAASCARGGLALVSDEVFGDYGWDEEPGRVRTVAGRELPCLAFSLSGLSKVAGLPGLKLGWTHVGGPPGARDEALARLELVADTYLPVGTPVQLALPGLLAHAPRFQEALLGRVRGNLRALRAARPPGAAWDVVSAHGGWSAVLRVALAPGEEATCLRLLREEGMLVQPGYFYDFASGAFLVLSLLPPPDVFAEAAGRLARVLG